MRSGIPPGYVSTKFFMLSKLNVDFINKLRLLRNPILTRELSPLPLLIDEKFFGSRSTRLPIHWVRWRERVEGSGERATTTGIKTESIAK